MVQIDWLIIKGAFQNTYELLNATHPPQPTPTPKHSKAPMHN